MHFKIDTYEFNMREIKALLERLLQQEETTLATVANDRPANYSQAAELGCAHPCKTSTYLHLLLFLDVEPVTV